MEDISRFKVPHTIFHVPYTSRVPSLYVLHIYFYILICGMYAGHFGMYTGSMRDVCGMHAGCMRDICGMYDVFENYIFDFKK